MLLPKALRTPATDQLVRSFLHGTRQEQRAARRELERSGATTTRPDAIVGGGTNRSLARQVSTAAQIAPFVFDAARTLDLSVADNLALFHATGATRMTVERNGLAERATRGVRGGTTKIIGQADLARRADADLTAIVLRSPDGLNHDVGDVFVSVQSASGPHVLWLEGAEVLPPRSADPIVTSGPDTAASVARDVVKGLGGVSGQLARASVKKVAGEVVGDAVEGVGKSVLEQVTKVTGPRADHWAETGIDKAGDRVTDTVADRLSDALPQPAAKKLPARQKHATYVAPPQAGPLEGRTFTFVRPVLDLDTRAPDVRYQQQRAVVASAARKAAAEQVRRAEQQLLAAGVPEPAVRAWGPGARAAAQQELARLLLTTDRQRAMGRPLSRASRALLLTSDGPAQLAAAALRGIATPTTGSSA